MEVYEIINKEFGTEYDSNNSIFWGNIIIRNDLSESIIDSCSEYIPWNLLLKHQILSEELMERHIDKINWHIACEYQSLSEDFMERHIDKIDFNKICVSQKLSEDFINKHIDKIDWFSISNEQKLSEDFIIANINKLDMRGILRYQNLSEYFIQFILDKLYSREISILCKYNRLSEEFIEKNIDKVDMMTVSNYQKLSENFIDRHNELVIKEFLYDNWIYKSAEEKKEEIVKTRLYECHDDYFIAYKAVRYDRCSLFNLLYKYEKGGIYESWCDCSNNQDSFGLNVGTINYAKEYASNVLPSYKIVRCKVRYEDVGRVVHGGEKVRCFKIEILD